jgi:hypothetical protein
LLASGSLLLTGCGGSPAGGDPGGRRLHELAIDRVFAAFPPGATGVHVTRTPAVHLQPGFTGGGWDGPSVVVTFASPAAPRSVYRFYARRALAAGWRPTASGSLGLTDRWTKTYADGGRATLLVSVLTRASAVSHRVFVDGGVATVDQ